MSADEKVHGTGNFVPGSVRIIDFNSSTGNMLVRGSSAFGAGNFTMDLFTSTIKAAPNYAATGISLSANPMIVDFCLIGYGPPNHKDARIVKAEANWFNTTHPELNGAAGPYPTRITAANNNLMMYWPILSTGAVAPTAAKGTWSGGAVLASLEAANNGFNFSGLVPAISNALNNTLTGASITNAVIYVHCDSGINRTGAAIIGYLMQYGSSIPALGIAANPPAPYHTLQAAQLAARINPPEGDSPAGGVDQSVAEAYCNMLNNSGNPLAPLSANCVPIAGTVNPPF